MGSLRRGISHPDSTGSLKATMFARTADPLLVNIYLGRCGRFLARKTRKGVGPSTLVTLQDDMTFVGSMTAGDCICKT